MRPTTILYEETNPQKKKENDCITASVRVTHDEWNRLLASRRLAQFHGLPPEAPQSLRPERRLLRKANTGGRV